VTRRLSSVFAVLVVLAWTGGAAVTSADEGQWMPSQIPELDASALARTGLRLPLSELHATDEQGREVGLLAATVNLSGCSAAFVSKDGLIATNHHCAYAAIQAASSVEHDYLTDGFVAKDRSGELEAKATTVQIVESVTDVTEQVRAIVESISDPAARARAVDDLRKRLVAECETKPNRRCRVAEFYGGANVQLITSVELRDVRLVYAPPSSVGNYGGEVDNWMWPRHTGDFSLLRAYVAADGSAADYAASNVPYAPARHLAIGQGVAPDDFVAVLGFPGTTARYQSAAEVARFVEQVYPGRIELYGEWIALMQAQTDKAAKLKVAAKVKSLQNRFKNAQGMVDGLRRNGTVERRRTEDAALRAWVDAHDDAAGKRTLDSLEALSAERRRDFGRDFVLENQSRGSNLLAVAIDVVRRARERTKPDLERVAEYMDRVAPELWATQTRRIKDFDPEVDRELLAIWLRHAARLPEAERFVDVGPERAAALVRSKLADVEYTEELWQADWATIERNDDPMIALARSLLPAVEAFEARSKAREGVMLAAGPKYFELVKAVRQGPVYPDANGTLRMSWGSVKGYSPREGLQAIPQTTVTGMIAKHTGADPFDVPQRIRDAAATSTSSRWIAPGLGDVPVAFLSNCDTTGGNSGSPVIDGDGKLVGLNFDRVWENVAGDFGYSTERSRNIVVDVRYLLWQLDAVEKATWILEELGVADRVAAAMSTPTEVAPAKPGAPSDVGVPRDPVAAPVPAAVGDGGCGCAADPTAGAWGSLWLVLPAIRRRGRRGPVRER
jgi:hypothetical protein